VAAAAPPGGVISNGSLSGLAPSVTGIIPHEDLTRKITEWVYSHITQLTPEDRDGVEIELKFGTLNDRSTDKRMDLPVVTETVIRPDYARANTFFKATMTDEQFGRINTFLDDLSNPQKKSNSLAPPVSRTDVKTRDVIYDKGGADKVRLTFDEHEQLIAKITKRRVNDLVIYSPGDLLDIRLSISVEKDYPNQVDRQQKPSTIRNKNRLSYSAKGIQIDLTSVISGGRQQTSKELELELDVTSLMSYYDSFQTKSDPKAMDKFEELIRYAVDNTRILARVISR
jgi:polynucleotide 5'-triphosphatase